MAPCNDTQQWHHVHSPKVGHHSPPQTIAHYNGTLQWHHVHSPRVGHHPPPNHSTLQWHPTITPSNGTTFSAPCNSTLVPRPIRQNGSSPSPPIGSKNPYSYRYLGNNLELKNIDWCFFGEKHSWHFFFNLNLNPLGTSPPRNPSGEMKVFRLKSIGSLKISE